MVGVVTNINRVNKKLEENRAKIKMQKESSTLDVPKTLFVNKLSPFFYFLFYSIFLYVINFQFFIKILVDIELKSEQRELRQYP